MRRGRSPNDAASRTPRPHPLCLLNEFRGSRAGDVQRATRAQAPNLECSAREDVNEAASDFLIVYAKRDEMIIQSKINKQVDVNK